MRGALQLLVGVHWCQTYTWYQVQSETVFVVYWSADFIALFWRHLLNYKTLRFECKQLPKNIHVFRYNLFMILIWNMSFYFRIHCFQSFWWMDHFNSLNIRILSLTSSVEYSSPFLLSFLNWFILIYLRRLWENKLRAFKRSVFSMPIWYELITQLHFQISPIRI